MHREILNAGQQELLPLMAQFRREFYLVGGTAIALHLGHRRSVDFDMFKMSRLNHKKNLDRIVAAGFRHQVTRRVDYLIANPPSDEAVRARLVQLSIDGV